MRENREFRVLVVGSKPKFTHNDIGSYDVALFANGAASRSPYFHAQKKICIVSALVLSQLENPLCELALEEIKKSKIKNYIILGSSCNNIFRTTTINELQNISRRKRTFYYIKFIGFLKYLKQLYKLSQNTFHLTKNLILIIVRGESRLLVPSTGIFSVIYAYETFKHIDNISIHVSGIGITSDGYDYVKGEYNRGHICADMICIDELIRKGVIFFDIHNQ